MELIGNAHWLDTSELRRARGARLLVLGNSIQIDHALALLRSHGVTTFVAEDDCPFCDNHACHIALICGEPSGDAAHIASECARLGMPFCFVLAGDSASQRLRALGLGARDVFSAHWSAQELFLRIVRLLAMAMLQLRVQSVHITLRKRMSAKNRILDRTRLEMVNRLGRAAEYRDNETGQHVIRVGKYCGIVAQQLGIPRQEVHLLRHASPLHDIGKIGIADSILLKKGPLDPVEWAYMKQHAAIGANILGGTDDELLEVARVVALTHHERWDGTGYPAGLAGDNIPRHGRIAAVCDVYDALTSGRPYKAAWPSDQAIEYLSESRGSHFDPEVVDAFIDGFGEIRAVQEDHSDSAAAANVYCSGDALLASDMESSWAFAPFDAWTASASRLGG
jgi:putative two-component system response regulator